MSREQMIFEIRKVYPGDNFAIKLSKMSDNQVYALYTRLRIIMDLDENFVILDNDWCV